MSELNHCHPETDFHARRATLGWCDPCPRDKDTVARAGAVCRWPVVLPSSATRRRGRRLPSWWPADGVIANLLGLALLAAMTRREGMSCMALVWLTAAAWVGMCSWAWDCSLVTFPVAFAGMTLAGFGSTAATLPHRLLAVIYRCGLDW